MIKGTCRFFQDGILLAEQDNLITTAGKRAILRYLAGQAGRYAEAIAVGSGEAAPNVSDSVLQFEFTRALITLTNVDYVTQTVTFKATLDQASVGKIYEVGIWSAAVNIAAGDFTSKLLASFEPETEAWDAGVFEGTNARLGSNALKVTATASTTAATNLPDILQDLSGYSNSDAFVLAVYARDANTSGITVRFKTDASNYFDVSTTVSAGYNVKSMLKSSATATGTPDWANITAVELRVTAGAGGSAVVDFDGLRIEDFDTGSVDAVLVTRAVLGVPITKTDSSPLDVEYTLDFSIT